jgi:hypothetical protein
VKLALNQCLLKPRAGTMEIYPKRNKNLATYQYDKQRGFAVRQRTAKDQGRTAKVLQHGKGFPAHGKELHLHCNALLTYFKLYFTNHQSTKDSQV